LPHSTGDVTVAKIVRHRMGEEHYQAFLKTSVSQDEGEVREELWVALAANHLPDTSASADREEVLRELLDQAHQRIRELEAAVRRLTSAEQAPPDDESKPFR
jgi:hypothetical protein